MDLGGPGEAGALTGGARDGIGDLTAVLAWTKIAAARLNELEGDDERIAGLAQEEAELAARVAGLAGTLTALRGDAAERFSRDVTAELTALAMPHARLTVASARWMRPVRMAPKMWRSGWPRTRARRPCRSARGPPAASCPG